MQLIAEIKKKLLAKLVFSLFYAPNFSIALFLCGHTFELYQLSYPTSRIPDGRPTPKVSATRKTVWRMDPRETYCDTDTNWLCVRRNYVVVDILSRQAGSTPHARTLFICSSHDYSCFNYCLIIIIIIIANR